MDNDERFLRQQIMSGLDTSKTKFISTLVLHIKEKIVDAAIQQWRRGNMTGKKAAEWSIKHARSNYKKQL